MSLERHEKGLDFYGQGYFDGTSGDRGSFSLVDIEEKYTERLQFLMELLTPDERARQLNILDVGAGAAPLARVVEAANDSVNGEHFNMSVASTDFSVYGINQVPSTERPPFFQSDIYRVPIADNSLDGVTGWDIIEHLDHPQDALSGLQRILKPNGFIHLITPNPDAYTRGTEKFTYTRDKSHIWPPIISTSYFEEVLPRLGFDTQVFTRGFLESGEYRKDTGKDLILPTSVRTDGTHIIAFGRKK